jgi:hypothetical protein
MVVIHPTGFQIEAEFDANEPQLAFVDFFPKPRPGSGFIARYAKTVPERPSKPVLRALPPQSEGIDPGSKPDLHLYRAMSL